MISVRREPVAWSLTASVFSLGILFAVGAWYLQNTELVDALLDHYVTRRSLPTELTNRFEASARDLPVSIFIFLVGSVLAFFCGRVLSYTQQAWSSITTSLEEYRDGLHQGILRFQGDAIRLLKYVDSDGILINTTAHDELNAPRNVLLNNLTVQRILSSICDVSEDQLEGVGASCGGGFGSVILSLNDIDRDDLRTLLFAWFKYDSNAGFGRFELVEGTGNIRIALRHNFLASGKDFRSPKNSLCAFMRGYIKGVIMSMPPVALARAGLDVAHVRVRHDSATEDCICTSHRPNRGCIFTIESA